MHNKLTTKLIWGIVALSSIVVIVTTVVLSAGIYLLSERGYRTILASGAQSVIVDYLRVVDGGIYQKERDDGQSLGVMLRNRDLSAIIVNSQGAVLARYGVDRDLEERSLPVKRVEQGTYEDIRIDEYGIFDTYTVPIRAGDEVYGWMRIMRKNAELIILRDAVLGVAIILLPLSWFGAAAVAWFMGRQLTSPLNLLVNYLESIKPEDDERVIHDSPKMDHEVWVVSQAINKLIERLRASMRRQKQIAENISHEFKTPLTRIASNLQVGKVKEAEMEVLELGGNVDALLSLSIWEKTDEETDLVPVIRHLIKLLPGEVRIQVKLPKKMITPLPSSHAAIIWRNILDNAIKHNIKGGYIKVVGEMIEGEWSLAVINSTQSGKLEARNMTKRKYSFGAGSGYGIGMSIVDEMCRLHHLRLEASGTGNEMSVQVRGT